MGGTYGPSHLPRMPPLLTFACRAIWRATKGRLRSDTILATLVSTRPSMSGETLHSHGAQGPKGLPTKPQASPFLHCKDTRLHS